MILADNLALIRYYEQDKLIKISFFLKRFWTYVIIMPLLLTKGKLDKQNFY